MGDADERLLIPFPASRFPRRYAVGNDRRAAREWKRLVYPVVSGVYAAPRSRPAACPAQPVAIVRRATSQDA
jgi:hypothetical protein